MDDDLTYEVPFHKVTWLLSHAVLGDHLTN